MKIKKLEGGYIITNDYGKEELHTSLQSVFDRLLQHFEGRSKFFGGNSFGVVEIHRKLNDKFKETEPSPKHPVWR